MCQGKSRTAFHRSFHPKGEARAGQKVEHKTHTIAYAHGQVVVDGADEEGVDGVLYQYGGRSYEGEA